MTETIIISLVICGVGYMLYDYIRTIETDRINRDRAMTAYIQNVTRAHADRINARIDKMDKKKITKKRKQK